MRSGSEDVVPGSSRLLGRIVLYLGGMASVVRSSPQGLLEVSRLGLFRTVCLILLGVHEAGTLQCCCRCIGEQ